MFVVWLRKILCIVYTLTADILKFIAAMCVIVFILWRSVKPLLRYGDFSFFCSKWRSSAILDLLYAFWTRVLRGFYRCAKSGWNRCSTVDYCNIFASSVWKRLFAPQMFGRILSLNGEQGQRNPQKTSARKHGTWHIRVRRSSKSVHRFGLGANRGIKFKRKVD